MDIKNLPLKFTLLALALLLCVWSLNLTPYRGPGLLEGLDLRGGVSMTFKIDLSEDAADTPTEDVTGEVIENLKRRLDPNGLMGLQFLPLRNNRICIRMPAAQPETLEAERLFRESMELLRDDNLSATQVRHFLMTEDPAAQQAAAVALAGGSESRLESLNALLAAHTARTQAQAAYNAARSSADKAAARIPLVNATAAYEDAYLAVLNTNINLENFRGNLMSNYVTDQEAQALKQTSDGVTKLASRRQALDTYINELKVAHTSRAGAIDDTVAKYIAWARLRQTLGDPSTLKRMVAKAGVLEFRIAPFSPYAPVKNAGADTLSADEMATFLDVLANEGPDGMKDRTDDYRWFPVQDDRDTFPNLVTAKYAGRKYILLYNRADKVMLAQRGKEGWELESAKESMDYDTGRPAVSFSLDPRGKKLMGDLTSNNVDRHMAILLDGEAYNAPVIREAITRGRGQITTKTQAEVPELRRTLNAGSLRARVNPTPTEENYFGPSLGQDNKEMGLRAGIWGLAAVATFMLVYYLMAGAIANVALIVNLLLVLGFMSLFRVVLTLPGIAGLLLTIGIAVDANVLIFERLREEQCKGQSPSMTIANAYRRAFSAIFDANLTTLITCLILGWIGTPEVRGFAVTLGLGVLFSMFSALIVTRWFFQALLNRGLIKKHVSMMRIIGTPKINWIAKRHFFWAISLLMITLGIVSLVRQKSDVMGIEFSSGTQVVITFRDDAMLTPPGSNTPELLSDGVVRSLFDNEASKLDTTVHGDKLISTARVEQRLTDQHDLVRKFLANHAGEDAVEVTRAQLGNDLFFDAINANSDDVLDRAELLEKLPPNEFQLSTTETNAQLVTDVATAAFGDQLKSMPACTFDLVTDTYVEAIGRETTADGLTPVPAPDSTARPELFADFDGGVVFVLENVTPALTEAELKNRLDETRYQPDFAEAPLAEVKVIGTHAADEGRFNAFVVLSRGDNLQANAAGAWTAFATGEKALLVAALERQDTLEMRNFDAQIAEQARGMAIMAIVLSCVAIVLYLWLRFGSITWGIAAVVCLAHDVIIVVGLVAASGWLYETAFGKALAIRSFKIDLAMIAAFLTVIGYSVNDTIVVFDRIRENRGRQSKITPDIINRSINQTLSRTVLTSMTTLVVVVIMYAWGGPGIHAFSFALLAGVIFGTYSSIAVASPLLLGIRKAIGRVAVNLVDDAPALPEDEATE